MSNAVNAALAALLNPTDPFATQSHGWIDASSHQVIMADNSVGAIIAHDLTVGALTLNFGSDAHMNDVVASLAPLAPTAPAAVASPISSGAATSALLSPTTSGTGAAAKATNLGTGDDTFSSHSSGNSPDWNLNGADGNDSISTDSGNDHLYGGDGNDTIDAGDGNNTIDGGSENDNVTAGKGNDNIKLGSGNDYGFSYNGSDTIDGGSGDDNVGGGNKVGEKSLFIGGTGNDNVFHFGEGDATLTGGDGRDNLSSYGPGQASLSGDAGDDSFSIGDGAHATVSGGAGADTTYVSSSGEKKFVLDLTDFHLKEGDLVYLGNVGKTTVTADHVHFDALDISQLHRVGDHIDVGQNAEFGVIIDHGAITDLHTIQTGNDYDYDIFGGGGKG